MVAFGDIVIAAAAFAAGWYSKPYIQAGWGWLKTVYSWLVAKF